MTKAILVGGPYHGFQAVESSDAEGMLMMIGAHGEQQYAYLDTVASLRFFKHAAVSTADARKLLASGSSRL
jgi:hypothetical protein